MRLAQVLLGTAILVVSLFAAIAGTTGPGKPSTADAAGEMCVPATGRLGWLYGNKPSSEGGGTHNGADIWGTAGVTPIYAAAEGDAFITTTSFGGTYVKIHHTKLGNVWSYYDHMGAANIQVANGQHVLKGQQIGFVGTDKANGVAHVHFAVNVTTTGRETNSNVDPSPYLGLNLKYGSNGSRPVAWLASISSNCSAPSPTTSGDRLLPGQQLSPGQSITSTNGCFMFVYQTDGNLVLYRTSGHVALWASNTERTSVRYAVMQTDGNLVIYNASGSAVWASSTNGSSGSWLVAQNDGNVVIYRPNGGPAIWATNTVRSC